MLRQQHEAQRLRHAIEYVSNATRTLKKLTSSELSRINQIIVAGTDTGWRFQQATIQIPSGKVHKFNLISNPIENARRILGDAYDMSNNNDVKDAAIFLYFQLVEEHLFENANRRTAALAAQWLLNEKDIELDTLELLEIPLGDVREPTERNELSKRILELMK